MMEQPSLSQVVTLLEQRLKFLPGNVAHEVMRARWRKDSKPMFVHAVPPRPGGVLILLYEHNGLVKFPLIKRAIYKGAHSGQISLPGGKAEEGEDRIMAALREGEEEIGVSRSEMKIIGKLSDFHVEPSNFLITPVIATVSSLPVFVPDPIEVADILQANLSDVTGADVIKEKVISVGNKMSLMAPHFEIGGEMVWGATAMILNEFRELLKS